MRRLDVNSQKTRQGSRRGSARCRAGKDPPACSPVERIDRPWCRSSGTWSTCRGSHRGACPVQGTGHSVMVRTLGTLDARATGRRVAGPMGANRAAGLQPGGTDRPAAVSIVGTWSTGRGWHRGACVARSRFTEGRVSARYQALRLPGAVSIDGERFATEGAACARCARCGVLASRGSAR